MGTFDNKTILILSQQGQDIMSQKQKIASWGYQVHFYDLQNPLNLNRQTHLVLIDIHLFQQTEISTKLKNLEKTAETIGIPILAYTIGQNIETATCKFPTICLNNIQLSRDYIRLLLLENERFENSDDLAKILMLKEREKENFRIKFEQNEQSYKSIFTTLLSPVLILSKWGNVITFSKGAQTLLGEELNQRQQLAKGIHPEDLKNIREIFKSFNQQQTQEANLIIRIKTQFSKYKTYKIYLTNYLNSQELKFVFVSIDRFEKSQKSKKVEVNSSLFTSFFNQFIEPSIFDKEQSKGSIIDGIMAIIPQIQYIAQVFFVQWDANQQQFVSGQQWCNTNKNFIQNFPVKIQQIKNPLKIFNYLRQHNLNEIQSAQYPIEITELSKDLATESIIPVCFFDSEQNGTIVIFALNKNLGHPSNEEFTISNQIIGNAVAYVQNQ
ncbi:MAG: hypothetical protein RIS47_1757, partial [Bacteroidota bacterium]